MVLAELQLTLSGLMANEMPKDRLSFLFTDYRAPSVDYITSVQAHIILIQRGVTRLELLARAFPRHCVMLSSNSSGFVRVLVTEYLRQNDSREIGATPGGLVYYVAKSPPAVFGSLCDRTRLTLVTRVLRKLMRPLSKVITERSYLI